MAVQEPIRTKVDRDEIFLEYTKSICPVCKRVIDAEINVRDNKVVMRKRCPEHGEFQALVYSDAELYMSQLRFNKPGTIPLEFQTEVRDGCPLDCGMCPDHKQHACLGIIEVNTGCNLDCPICFADSGHQPDGYSLTHDQVSTMLDTFVRAEGTPEVVMLSGGEPTIHPSILDFIEMAYERGIKHVFLNTNGIRLARDEKFASDLGALKPHIYLQFDGFDVATHMAIRGRDLRVDKERALEACAESGLNVTLVAAIEKGVNEHEVGEIVQHGVKHPAVMSVAFQPVTHSGRHIVFDPLERLTNADVMKLMVEQLPDWFQMPDFVPVPCCYPTCRTMSYALVNGDDLIPLPRFVEFEDYLDYISNRLMPDLALREVLEKMFSASAAPGVENLLFACESCGIDTGAIGAGFDDPFSQRFVFAIIIQDFQDPYTLNVRQLMKCCVSELTPDGRMIPFCAYNSVGYREEVRAALSGTPVAPVVPNSKQLLPVLEPTPYGSRTVPNGNENGRRNLTNVGKRLGQ